VVVSLVRPDDAVAVKAIQRKLGFPEGTTAPGVMVAPVAAPRPPAARPPAAKAQKAKPKATVAGHARRNERSRRRRASR
jgi:hypothetical protein